VRTFLSLLTVSAAVTISSILFPVVAGDFEARDIVDPLDPMALTSDQVTEPKPDDQIDESLKVKATLEPSEIEEKLAPPVVSAPSKPRPAAVVRVITGEASWYGPGFYGNRTANGEVFRPGTMTAAHRHLPFGTKVRVTNLWNGRSAVIRINDRGPFIGHRVIDLAHGAASHLGLTASGIAQVRLEVLR
tara:strand:- start:1686 stop:2252 length:567 start_codon:yes stop_codon:yes gene_type:complete